MPAHEHGQELISLRRGDGTSIQRDSESPWLGPAKPPAAFFFIVLLAIGCASVEQASSQALPADEPPTTLSGTVVNSVTHAPISRALVYSADNRFAALTDGEGHFEFALPKPGKDTQE
jgi:hypothetical protein